MANTTAVYARIDTGLKENAEEILSQLGITPSSAIQMLYSQIVLTRGLPLNLHLPSAKSTAIGGMSRAELDKSKNVLYSLQSFARLESSRKASAEVIDYDAERAEAMNEKYGVVD